MINININDFDNMFYCYFVFILFFVLVNNKNIRKNVYLFYKKIISIKNKESNLQNNIIDKDNQIDNNKETQYNIIEKYEEKYLEKMKIFDKDIIFTKEDIQAEETKYEELIDYCLNKRNNELKILEDEKELIIKNILLNENDQIEKDPESDNNFTKLQNDIAILTEYKPDLIEIHKEAYEYAMNRVLDKLQNNYVMEKTPLGNIAMCYNNKKGSFEYYSDNAIPYRYLETVARKYVITFHCKNLYIDMNTELKNAEIKKEEKGKANINVIKTKDVFTQFKNSTSTNHNGKLQNYQNKRNNSNVNNKSNLNNTLNVNNNSNGKIILKENANRFTHNGKFVNFMMLKKVDKQKIDKNYSLSYKDFMKKKIELMDNK
jgi:hypothetical protein